MFSTQNQVDLEAGLKQLVDDEGYAYAAGYMGSMMKEMLNLLPKRKQKEFLQQLQAHNDNRCRYDEGYAAGYMSSMMKEMLNLLPKRKQKEFLQQLQAHNDNFQVEVQSLGNGAMVKIRRKDRGGPSDPSTERHWSM